MKATFILISILSFNLLATDFFKLSEEEKLDFISDKAEEIWSNELVKEFKKNNKDFVKKLVEFGEGEANVWWDTIYEGPYSPVSKDVEVDIDYLYKYDGKIIAVRGRISQEAVMIDSPDCNYDDDKEAWVGECYEGNVSQGFYMDLKGNYLDSGEYADFDY